LIFTRNQMKRKAAFVEEEDSKTGEVVLGTESSASIFLPPEQSSEQRKTWRRSGSDFVSDLESTHLGTVLNVVEQSKNEGGLLTVVAGEHEDNAEVWEECKNAGTKFRLFALKGCLAPTNQCLMLTAPPDSIINGETKTYIAREILLSKEGGDLDRENPSIIIGQRKFSPNSRIRLEAHRLFFADALISIVLISSPNLGMRFLASDAQICIAHFVPSAIGRRLSSVRISQAVIVTSQSKFLQMMQGVAR
jgi:hypothetical protein